MKLCICLAFGLTVVYGAGLSRGSVISDLIDFKDDPLQVHDSAKDEEFGSKKKRAIGAATATLLSAAITAGTSVVTSALGAQTGACVTVRIEMENFSKWFLSDPRVRNHQGHISIPPTLVKPQTKEAMLAQITDYSATGSRGVVSWRFVKGGTAYRALVMWAVPYDIKRYTNWLSLGIRHEQPNDPTFDDMYRNNEYWFDRKPFYYNANTLKFCKYGVCVSGSMGTIRKPTVIVRFIPQRNDDFAAGLRNMMDG